jgi:CheY-like chemotaxis protein
MSQRLAPVVLVVEDEHLIRMLAVDAFSDAGFLVVEAQNAAEALRMYAAHTDITVLFTDVNMPGAMNGIDLAESLKALAPDLHVLVTSALPILRPVDHLSGLFIPKPYDLQDVCGAARRLLAA